MIPLTLVTSLFSIVLAVWSFKISRETSRILERVDRMRTAGDAIPHTSSVPHRPYAADRERMLNPTGPGNIRGNTFSSSGSMVGVPKDPPPGGSGFNQVSRVWRPGIDRPIGDPFGADGV